MPAAPREDLSVDDRFFIRIATKNRLLTQAQAEQAVRSARGQPLSRVVQTLGLLDQRQVQRIREAMAASQIMRLDALFAEILTDEGLVSPGVLDAAFAEQRRQAYRARIGNILVQRGKLSDANHRRIVSEVIRRLRTQGSGAFDSQAAPTSPAADSDSGPLFGSSEESGPLPASAPQRPPFFGSSAEVPTRGRLNDTLELEHEPLFGRESADFQAMEERADASAASDLTASAVRISLDGEGFDVVADQAFLESDLRDSVDRWAKGESSADRETESSGFVLERDDLGAVPEGFLPEEYLRRRRTRTRLVIVAVGALGLAILGVAGVLGARAFRDRGQFQATLELVREALAEEDATRRQELLEAAEVSLREGGTAGVSQEERDEVRQTIEWSLLEAGVLAALGEGQPERGLAQLLAAPSELTGSPSREEDYARLERRCKREQRLLAAREAESRSDWSAAVHLYRDAMTFGDPGAVASRQLEQIRANLLQQMQAALVAAKRNLKRSDEAHYAALAKLVQELFKEGHGAKREVAELAFRRAKAEAMTLGEGEEKARRALRHALDMRPEDKELQARLGRVEQTLEAAQHERAGRRAEGSRSFAKAIGAFRLALELARKLKNKTLEGSMLSAIKRCEGKLANAAAQAKRGAKLQRCVAQLRASEVSDALEGLRALLADAPDPRIERLARLAERVEGMVYVGAGPFLMGSRSGPREEQPQRRLELEAFFVSRTEITNEEYSAYVLSQKVDVPKHWATPRRLPSGDVEGKTYASDLKRHPVVQVSWERARDYAAWRGGELPTEAQWEKSARGSDGRDYPWGEGTKVRAHVQIDPTRFRRAFTAPVGAHIDDKSPFGLYDMAGNVQEWTRDAFLPYPKAPQGAPARPERKVLRGGAWRWPWTDARCARRQSAKPTYANDKIGFRIVVEIPKDLAELR